MRCHHHSLEFLAAEDLLEHVLNDHLDRLEELMTEINDDQKHLDDDVAALQAAFAAEVAALKAQIGANPTVMAAHLDFTALDALVGAEQAELNTVPSVTQADDPSLAVGGPAVAPIAPTQASPFVDPEEQDEDAAPVEPSDPEWTDPAAGTTADPTQDAAPTSPGVTADTVVDPADDVTPSTENPPTE